MRRFWWCGLVWLGIVLSGCGGGGGSSIDPPPVVTTGTVAGYVYGDQAAGSLVVSPASRASGQPVAGVTVTVRAEPGLTATTDVKGYFILLNVPIGMQQLYFSGAGYPRLTLTIPVRTGLNTVSSQEMGTPAQYRWTVLVYMAADNDLETAAINDLNEMEQVGSTPDVKVLVQVDRSPQYDTSNGNWTGTRRLEIVQDTDPNTVTSPVIADLGQTNSGSATELQQFIAWGQAYAPAEHYLVVLWDHGSGWDPNDDRVPTARAICYDYSSGMSAIRIPELSTALAGPHPIDILAADACLMSMIEVAYQVRRQADYFVSSEEESPIEGYAYERILAKLTSPEGLAMSPAQLAAFMAQDAYQEWQGYADATCSTIDLGALDALAGAIDGFAQRLTAIGGANATAVVNAQRTAERFGPSSVAVKADLRNYASLISASITDVSIRQAANAVMTAIDRAVIANYHGSYHPEAYGISIYLPTASDFSPNAGTYRQLAFSSTSWDEWLAAQPTP